jgi:DNA-3-methyladenine glycosylase
VRAVEPILNVAHGVRTDGPGRLTRALGITREDDAGDLVRGSRIHLAPRTKRPRITVSARVGVGYAGDWADEPWRFLDSESTHVSKPAAKTIGRGR